MITMINITFDCSLITIMNLNIQCAMLDKTSLEIKMPVGGSHLVSSAAALIDGVMVSQC